MATEMAYVDPVLHMPDDYGHDDYGGYGQGSLVIHNKMPLKEILLAVTLLALGTFGIVLGFFFIFTQTGADQARGFAYVALGALLFLPGFYESRIAYYAYKGYKGFSFANIPAV